MNKRAAWKASAAHVGAIYRHHIIGQWAFQSCNDETSVCTVHILKSYGRACAERRRVRDEFAKRYKLEG